ncbi:MAG: hypothetical protein Q9166_001854 [cf. Caloplaca sp. 2 TL-2023]
MRANRDIQSSRSRKDHEPITSTPSPFHGPPTSFFLATEEDLRNRDSDSHGVDSTFGVRSLQETPDEAKEQHDGVEGNGEDFEEDLGKRRSTLRAIHKPQDGPHEDSSQGRGGGSESPLFGQPRLSSTLPSVSSLSQGSHGVHLSLPSSPKSNSSRSGRPSDQDSAYDDSSQAVASSEDEADQAQSHGALENAPQLVMPSIQMPSRRPFTERGRNMGKLKVLVAGDSGLGKTSLIKSIVQLCEGIVHVDPVTSTTSSVDQLTKSTEKGWPSKAFSLSSTSQVSEIWASTKAYPGWWTEVEENKSQRRRKSTGEIILERNICFVDTPGYGRGLSITEGIQAIISYIEEQVARPFSATATNKGELVSMLSGNGGTQVDVVLYLIRQETKPADLDFVQRLSQVTNVIPVLAQADTIASEHLGELKSSISDELARSGISCFTLGTDDSVKPPYAVCSAPSNDEENMDASLLMSSDYIQPLLPSELSFVIDHLFHEDTIARLRHLSAKKIVQSKTALQLLSTATSASGAISGSTHTTSSSSKVPTLTLDALRSDFHPQERLAEYTRQEEKRAQIRLAKWANDLRRTMRNERAQFEELQQVERTTWLSQKLEECKQGKSLSNDKIIIRSELASATSPFGLTNSSDPLGLLRYDESLRRHGWQLFQIVGTFGLFGAAAWWITREWSSSSGWVVKGDGCSDRTFSWMHNCRPSIY